MQDTCMAIRSSYTLYPYGLVYRQWLSNQLSIRREPGDRIPHSVLPPAEMGTAQQENPVAQLTATFNFEVSKRELLVIRQALAERSLRADELQREGLLEEDTLEADKLICDALVSLVNRTLDSKFNY